MAQISSFDCARQTFARFSGRGGGGHGFGGHGGGFGGGGHGFGGGGRGYHNWHGGHGYGRGWNRGYGYPYYAGMYSYPYYDYLSYVPVAVDNPSCNQGPGSQQAVTFYNGHCVEDSRALERFATELNCCPGSVVRPVPGSACQSNANVSQRMYHCAYN